ncbi:MAG TPA: hypothetical protein ACFCUC_11310 [Desulfobacterales bacterium]
MQILDAVEPGGKVAVIGEASGEKIRREYCKNNESKHRGSLFPFLSIEIATRISTTHPLLRLSAFPL